MLLLDGTVSPVFVDRPMDVTLNETDNLSLTCSAFGFPLVIIQWLVDGAVLPEDQSNTSVTDRSNEPPLAISTLTIFDVTFDNNKTYTCRVQNDPQGYTGDVSAVTNTTDVSAGVYVQGR